MDKILKAHNKGSYITFLDAKELKKALEKLPEYIDVVLKKEKKSRSNSQNRYYWGVLIDILANEFGYSPEEMHEIVKSQFLKNHVIIQHGLAEKEVEIIKSTTELSTVEMEEYFERIRVWASQEFGIHIPAPHGVDV